MYNLFSPFLKNLRIWHCYQSCSFVYNSAILLQLVIHWWIFIFPAHIAVKDESKDGIMDSFPRCTKNGNREESFKTNRAIFYFPFGALPVFPLDTIRIKQTDPLLRRNEKLIRKGGGHNRLSFIARLDRETKGDSQRNFGPKYYPKLQVISFFKALWLGRQ